MNRGSLLERSLRELANWTLPNEILVIDDGGTDDTEGVCQRMADLLPIRYLFHDNPGPSLCSEARNVGLKSTEAEILVTCEPECYFKTDAIAQMLAIHGENPSCIVNAGTVEKERRNGSIEVLREWQATHCTLFRRDWLLEIGGWDESFPDPWGWEDEDLVTRLNNRGHEMLKPQEIIVRHQWHDPVIIDQGPNSKHFFDKLVDEDRTVAEHLVVANQGTEWGKLKSRR